MEHLNQDWFLASLVGFANRRIANIGVTLWVPGGIISGVIISHSDYLEEFKRLVLQGVPAADVEAAEPESQPEAEERSAAEPQFINLRNATITLDGQQVIRGLLWRGRLSEVGGFSLGQLDNPR